MSEEYGVCNINYLPENCISCIISLTSPRDGCRCMAVSTAFHAAAVSNTVWERFLPPDYLSILSRAVHPVSVSSSSKKELYFLLCNGILLDHGKAGMWLERESGAKCYALPTRELDLPWYDGSYSWKWIPHPRSRFLEVAELVDTSELDIHGKVQSQMLSPNTNYAAYLIYNTVHGCRGLSFPDQEMTLTIGDRVSTHTVCLKPDDAEMKKYMHVHRWAQNQNKAPQSPQPREDGWMEVEMGDFYNGSDERVDIKMSFEILGYYKKSGLVIQGIEIRPLSIK